MARHGHVLALGRYTGVEAAEGDGEPFEEKMSRQTAELREQMERGRELEEGIVTNLQKLGYRE